LLVAASPARAGEPAACAGGPSVPGLDASQYQGKVSWPLVWAAGYRFAFLRVNDGTNDVDPTFADNWAGAKAAGLLRGAYQYFRPGEDVKEQASIIIKEIGRLKPGDLPVVMDIESLGGQAPEVVIARMRTWLALVKKRTGKTPVIYTNPATWSKLDEPDFSEFPLWIASWAADCPAEIGEWKQWRWWQHSSTGRMPGISADVDLDLFRGSFDDLKALAGLRARPPAATKNSAPAAGAEMSGAGVHLAWAPVAGATSYDVRMRYWNGRKWIDYHQWSTAAAGFDVWPQVDACTYEWRARACSGRDCSAWSRATEFDYDR
jgi:GH25 family lysozyme M1 (1,4-beta-N-acetylmuramidase)